MFIVSESIWNKENCLNILVIVYTFWGIEISFVCLFIRRQGVYHSTHVGDRGQLVVLPFYRVDLGNQT